MEVVGEKVCFNGVNLSRQSDQRESGHHGSPVWSHVGAAEMCSLKPGWHGADCAWQDLHLPSQSGRGPGIFIRYQKGKRTKGHESSPLAVGP